ncbi:hypothetical protein BT69DRAFT_761167 [Atractiella rhizophila]|nr:hypothetical protein BT69DRAFT_761167 [Atractiella rhizophila]
MPLPPLAPPASLSNYCQAHHAHQHLAYPQSTAPRFPDCLAGDEDAIRQTSDMGLIVDFLDYEALRLAVRKEKERSRTLGRKRKRDGSFEGSVSVGKRRESGNEVEETLWEFCHTYHAPDRHPKLSCGPHKHRRTD